MATDKLHIESLEGPQPELGPGVFGRIGKLVAGQGVRIGALKDASFRRVAGVRIDVDELILGDDVVVEREVQLKGRQIQIEKGSRIKAGATLSTPDFIRIGAGGTVGEDCEIASRGVTIGRQLWMLPFSKIGGGSANEIDSGLEAGPWLHLGMHTLLNTAKKITLGREVGLGTRTSLYTHGAYPSMLRGAPVTFAPISVGDFSWLPGAVVNPGVSIGKHCIIGVNSLVTRNIPDGSMAAGSPAKIVKENAYPKKLTDADLEGTVRSFLRDYAVLLTDKHAVKVVESEAEFRIVIDSGRRQLVWRLNNEGPVADGEIRIGKVAAGGSVNISLERYTLTGVADADSQRFVNQLRRHGVRFDVEAVRGVFVPWE